MGPGVAELTEAICGYRENGPELWPARDEVASLASVTSFSFADLWYLRRYYELWELELLTQVAASFGYGVSHLGKALLGFRSQFGRFRP